MKKIVIIILCISILMLSVIIPVTAYADSYFESWASDKYKTYETAEYAPVGLVSTYGAISYFVTVTEVDYRVLLDGYKWYYTPLTVFAIDRYGADFGYCFWIDANGDYQHFMYSTVDDGNSEKVENVDITDATPAQLTGEEFADIIARLNDQYGVKDAKKYISIQNDKRYSSSATIPYGPLSFFNEGEFCGQTNWLECYLLPFYFDGSKYYYGLMEYHYSQELVKADDGNHVYLDLEIFSLLDDTVSYTSRFRRNGYDTDFSLYRYMDLRTEVYRNYGIDLIHYNSYSDYVSKSNGSASTADFSRCDLSNLYSIAQLYSQDCISSGTYDDYVHNSVYSNAYCDDPDYVDGIDYGFFISNEPIEMGLNWTGIDPEQIDPELTVTMDGDTFYDYSVTTVNGDTTTINEYVTNNYTINIDGGNSSGSGSTSGNVNVSGNIGVGGEVDININVNENSSMPVEVDVENYIEVLPEQAKPVTNILALFFDFLPAELLALILAGVAVAIILRIWGR